MTRTVITALVLGAAVAGGVPPKNVGPLPVADEIPWISLPPGEVEADALYQPKQVSIAADVTDWSVDQLKCPEAWKKGLTGEGVVVAVHDTGIMQNHRDLKDGILEVKDFTGSRFGAEDRNGHGTHCAGSIGARKNGWGLIGGAYECKLLVSKVLGDAGSGRVDWIAAGIDWATDRGADVQSLSLGGGGADTWIPPALERAEKAGVILIVAAGNDRRGPISFPGAYRWSNAITAVDRNKRLADFSNVGAEAFATGPGVAVRSTYPGAGDGLFADLSGTSMATPNVAAVAALWVQADKKAGGEKLTRPARFREWVQRTAEDLGGKGRDREFGWGLPDASKIEVKQDPPPKPPVPEPPAPGGVTIGLKDLTPEARKKLEDAGVVEWSHTIRVKAGASGAAQGVTLKQLQALVLVGPVRVRVGGVGEAGFVLTEVPEGLPPGVYDVDGSMRFKEVK